MSQGTPYDHYHVVDIDTIPQFSQWIYKMDKTDPYAGWTGPGWTGNGWKTGSFPAIKTVKDKNGYFRRDFYIPESCTGGYIDALFQGTLYVDKVIVGTNTESSWKTFPIPFSVFNSKSAQHCVAIKHNAPTTSDLTFLCDAYIHCDFSALEATGKGINIYTYIIIIIY